MSSIVPDLDTTDFDQLVETARGLIPRYAPGWTDHNLHDPGMTLIDLLAWMVDQQVYRVGHLSDRLLEAFAALLGQRPGEPSAARGLVWPDERLVAAYSLQAGSKVRCQRRPDLGFVLDHDLYLSDAELGATVLVVDGVEVPVPLQRSTGASVVVASPEPGGSAALILRFDRPLVAASDHPVSVGFEVVPPPGPPPDGGHPWGPLAFDYRIGTDDWLAVPVVDDRTSALAVTGAVLLAVPGTNRNEPSELRLALDRGFFPIAPQLRRVAIDVLPVVQHEIEPAGPIASGTGLPGQEVPLDSHDLVSRRDKPRLSLLVSQDAWKEVDDFADSDPTARHYVRDDTRLTFGNGVNGDIPPSGAQIAHDGLVRTCGAEGNLRAGLAWSVPAVRGGHQTFGHNQASLSGGRPAPTVASLQAEARRVATGRRVLLTDDDLRAAARELPGFSLARAEVLAGFDHALPMREVDGVRTLLVIPHRDRRLPPRDVPRAYVDAVRQALEEHRVLGERLVVRGPRYRGVVLALTVTAEPGADPATVEEAVERRVRQRLSDLDRGDGIEPWPFGRPVTVEEMKTLAAGVDDVLAVPGCEIAPVGEALGTDPIEIERDAVAVLLTDDAVRVVVQPALGPDGEVMA